MLLRKASWSTLAWIRFQEIRDKRSYLSHIKHSFSFWLLAADYDRNMRYINNILTVGMVPALFPDDEKEPLVGAIRARPADFQISFDRSLQIFHVSGHEEKESLKLECGLTPVGLHAWSKQDSEKLLHDLLRKGKIAASRMIAVLRLSGTICILSLPCHLLVLSSAYIPDNDMPWYNGLTAFFL